MWTKLVLGDPTPQNRVLLKLEPLLLSLEIIRNKGKHFFYSNNERKVINSHKLLNLNLLNVCFLHHLRTCKLWPACHYWPAAAASRAR